MKTVLDIAEFYWESTHLYRINSHNPGHQVLQVT